MEKPARVRIIAITNGEEDCVYGLGSDGQIYYWYPEDGIWLLDKRGA